MLDHGVVPEVDYQCDMRLPHNIVKIAAVVLPTFASFIVLLAAFA